MDERIKSGSLAVRVVIAAIAVAIVTGPALAASNSVVGRWSEPGGSCSGAGITLIKPLSLRNDDVVCIFKSVKRKGSTVTWQGICDDVEGASQQTVTAAIKGKRLTYRFAPGGNWVGPLRRCP